MPLNQGSSTLFKEYSSEWRRRNFLMLASLILPSRTTSQPILIQERMLLALTPNSIEASSLLYPSVKRAEISILEKAPLTDQ